MAVKNPVDISDLIRDSYADEFQFSEASVGQVPFPVARGLSGSNGHYYHSATQTLTIVGRIHGVEIYWKVTGENYREYQRTVAGDFTKMQKDESIFKFLRKHNVPKHNVPYEIKDWPQGS